MKSLIYLSYVLTVLTLAFVIKAATAQDVLEVAPEQYKVLFENEHVRVLEVRMKPGDKQEMHTHPATVHIELTSGKIKFTYPNGRTVTCEGKAGEAGWVDPVKHSLVNVGDTEIHAYIVELKDFPYEVQQGK
jgi:quercetin dioxygenase-like cupin family protein